MTFWEIILLGIVQGLTEFLPVSSSGHLLLANAVLESLGSAPVKDLIEVSIVLHLGTLAAVLVYYRHPAAQLFASDRRLLPILILATIPAVVVGLLINDSNLENLLLAGLMFPVTAAGLIWASRQEPGEQDYRQLRPGQALVIGLLQALAILPGISRSGATIASGLGAGLQRESATTFSFLLAIPVIAGGGLLKGIEAYQMGATSTPVGTLAVGFVVSFLVGLVALRLVIQWVQKGRLAIFAYYLLPLGVAVVVWQLLG